MNGTAIPKTLKMTALPCLLFHRVLMWSLAVQKWHHAHGKVDTDVILDSGGPRLYGSVFQKYTAGELKTPAFVGAHEVCPEDTPLPDDAAQSRHDWWKQDKRALLSTQWWTCTAETALRTMPAGIKGLLASASNA